MKKDDAGNKFIEFMTIVRRLRSECPWDREQTHHSIRHSLIEEAYEVVEAIDHNDLEELKKELGDLLLHVALHSIMAEETATFTIEDVLTDSMKKLVRRHPHVFADTKVGSVKDVKTNWERIKMSEGRTSLMDGVPKELPALLRAHRLQEKASKVGFDWKKKEDVWGKVREEIDELQAAEKLGSHEQVEDEFGDLLFALVNYARFVNVNPENALRRSTRKFAQRFQGVEEELRRHGKRIEHSTLDEMDAIWNEGKRREK